MSYLPVLPAALSSALFMMLVLQLDTVRLNRSLQWWLVVAAGGIGLLVAALTHLVKEVVLHMIE